MQIDWITVAAQIVNFLVLIWLLHHFLYGPITRAMDRREQRIADRLRVAAERKDEAEAEAQTFRDKQEELERRQDRLLADAREKAENERLSLEKSAREEVERRKKEWIAHLVDQQEDFLRNIRRQTTERFLALSRRALTELANANLESEIAEVFVDRLKQLGGEARDKIARACGDDGDLVVINSGFELSANDKRRITKAIHDDIAGSARVEYHHGDNLACGIELRAGNQTVVWSIDGYFDNLQDAIAQEFGRIAQDTERQAAQ